MTTTTKEDRIEMAVEALGNGYDNMVEAAYQFTKLYQELRATTGESDQDWQSDSGWCLYWAAGLRVNLYAELFS
jgi:hypothetical protein